MVIKTAKQQRPNDERNPGTSYPTNLPEINTELTIHTSGDGTALAYDDILESGVKHLNPHDAECVYDGSGRLPQEQRQGHSLDSPDATQRYGDAQYRQIGEQSSHKGPHMKEHSVADNAAISRMFSGYDTPISSGINKAGGQIGKSNKGINA